MLGTKLGTGGYRGEQAQALLGGALRLVWEAGT